MTWHRHLLKNLLKNSLTKHCIAALVWYFDANAQPIANSNNVNDNDNKKILRIFLFLMQVTKKKQVNLIQVVRVKSAILSSQQLKCAYLSSVDGGDICCPITCIQYIFRYHRLSKPAVF